MYAPLGFALEARSLLPRFVDRGRNQIVLARVVGKYAVRKGTKATEARLADAQGQVLGMLRLVGMGSEPTPTPAPGDGVGSNGHAPTSAAAERRPAPAERPSPPFPADELAIPDYDALSASQVVPRLESLTPDELDAVRRYEEGTRGRKTILTKISQLQSP